jgi:NodT family efflux transporter outer membrane factor (OMF) lipoprotein
MKEVITGLVVALVLALTGCAAVGPDYVQPTPELPDNWNSPTSEEQGNNARRLAGWWQVFDDPLLSRLIEQTASDNLDVREAVSRVRAARLQRSRTESSLFPALDGSAAATKSERRSEDGRSSQSETYMTGFDAGWELDIFGGVRRSVEASRGDLEAEAENLHDVVVSLLAEVALNYIDLRTYQRRLTLARANVALQQETWELLDALTRSGGGDALALAQARYNLESSKARLPGLEVGAAAAMNRLAVLTGKAAGTLHRELDEPAPLPEPSLQIAVGVPADILRQRPDIRRGERELAAQTARIGVAEAARYPRFTLRGSIGLEAISLDKLITSPGRLWSFGPSISLPIFDAGAIRNNIEIQGELQQQAYLRYESTVLAALEEVENALIFFAKEQQRLENLRRASVASRLAADLAEQKYTTGLTGFSDVLDAQRSLLSFEDQMAESSGAILAGLVRIYKSLGGGWQNMTPTISAK